jgi:hypothetical protein
MFELFVVGTFWFWALIIAEIVLLFMFVEYENGVGATVSLIIFACALQWCGDVNLVGFIFDNPLKLLAMVAAYFLLGGVWGTIKWWIFSKDRLEEYEELRDDFLRNKNLPAGTAVPQQFRREWKEKLERHRGHGRYGHGRTLAEAPRARDNKSRIMRWMSFWPVSMLWSFLDDFVKRVFKTIYHRISNFLQRISDNMFAKSTASEDLAGIEDEGNE